MKYAVIQLAGKQYKVSEGETFTVNSLNTEEGKEIKVSDVLLTADGDKTEVGAPLIKNAAVTLKVVSNQKRGENSRGQIQSQVTLPPSSWSQTT